MDGSSIYFSESRVFSFDYKNSIRFDFLQSIYYRSTWQRISDQINEFASVCIFSGLPDTGIVWVAYIPQKKLVEPITLKYYFISLHNFGIYQEDVTSRIFNNLNSLLEPKELLYKTRDSNLGGSENTCTINSNEQKT